MKICVSGASGFIGSHFLRRVMNDTDHTVRALVRNTDQRNLKRLQQPAIQRGILQGRIQVIYGDLLGDISGLCEGVDAVVHFAAKTYVDHSIKDASVFVKTNVLGTFHLLEEARRHKIKRFVQVSTDEVYGSILQGSYTEEAPINPTNPYAATKAGADALAISYAHTYGLHTVISRTENNYGPNQHPQKVFPVFTKKALSDEPLPVYGDGGHVRQWLHVDDHVSGLFLLLEGNVPPGEVFHIAGNQELTNLELARRILKGLNKPEGQIQHIDDHDIRPGHDRRYALNCDKLRALGWEPKVSLDVGIPATVEWYANNPWWSE